MKLDPRREALLKRTFLDYQQTTAFIENPIVVNRAEGLYYWDIEGRRYFDGIGGIFVAILMFVSDFEPHIAVPMYIRPLF